MLSELYHPAYKTAKNETLLQLMFTVTINLEKRIADLKNGGLS